MRHRRYIVRVPRKSSVPQVVARKGLRERGFEPRPLSGLDPKSSASASSATLALHFLATLHVSSNTRAASKPEKVCIRRQRMAVQAEQVMAQGTFYPHAHVEQAGVSKTRKPTYAVCKALMDLGIPRVPPTTCR